MTRRVHAGRVASKGVAPGILRRDRPARTAPARPATSLIGAIATTLQQLNSLQGSAGRLGSEILQFQIEMLEDDVFVSELLDRAAELKNAQKAIQAVLNEQIGTLLQSDSETFATRATDLADLRDRLLASFGQHDEKNDATPGETILLVHDITPSRFLEMDWTKVKGVVAQAGSTASHVALLARSHCVPMLVGIGEVEQSMLERPVLLDAISGRLIVDPEPAELELAAPAIHSVAVSEEEGFGPAILPDGSQFRVNLSVNSLAALDEAPREWFDGIGLVRTELLLRDPEDLVREDAQTETYRRLFDWAEDRPVTIRLFDAGGDKMIRGFSLDGEANAFLGTRGARLLAKRPDVLLKQYRAILAAAAGRPVRILIPMLTLPREMPYFREALQQAIEQRRADPASVSLGMMVETPSAAIEIGKFGADFFAIGTNDLIQYTLAVSRDNNVLDFSDEIAPAVLDLIARVAKEANRRGSDVTLCGDAVTSRVQLKQILECGIRSIAIPGRFAPRFKHFIRHGE
jgi:phosphotransferase system enzyme I (PtsI)